MTSKIKVNVSHRSIQAYFGKQWFNQVWVVMAIIVAALFLGACGNALPESQTPSQNEELSIQRSVEAEARYEAMADSYTTENDVSPFTTLAANPELAVVQRYGVIKNESSPMAFDVEALRETYYQDWGIEADAVDSVAESDVSSSTILAANPELAVVQRYAVAATTTESDVLAANPELMVAQRYGVIKNETGQPVTFDVEALRETYYQDWGIEVDAIDVNPNEAAKIEGQRVHFAGR